MGMGPRLAAATLLAVASGPVGVAAVLAADEVPYNSKLELNAGGRAFEGTGGYLTRNDVKQCEPFVPQFPSCSPWVTSVGGTQLLRTGTPMAIPGS